MPVAPIDGTEEGTALDVLARTATTDSADLTNTGRRNLILFLRVTAASGTGGLQVQAQAKDPLSGGYAAINSVPSAVIATGTYLYMFGPGCTNLNNGAAQISSGLIPRTWRVHVIHGDASSYTYSVGYSLS